jgi:uncharacterized protein YciI
MGDIGSEKEYNMAVKKVQELINKKNRTKKEHIDMYKAFEAMERFYMSGGMKLIQSIKY